MQEFEQVASAIAIVHEQLDKAISALPSAINTSAALGRVAELSAISADLTTQLAAMVRGVAIHLHPTGRSTH